jgi:SAM-dependent methyltransferase
MDVDSYIEHYEKRKNWTHLEWPKHQTRLKRCASYLEGWDFADVGCAFGYSTYYLSKFRPGEWMGIDFSKRAIREATKNFPNIEFKFLDSIEDLGRLESLDSVVCSGTIEHIEDDKTLVKGLLEITQRILVITTPRIPVVAVGHLRLYNRKMLETLFNGLNYEISKDDYSWYVVIRNA